MNTRQRKKYIKYYGWTIRANSLPMFCFNDKCPYHSKCINNDCCKYNKCRLRLCRPTMANDFNEAKQNK
ncbi:hypothetical protein [Clostridium saccharoperbutylacetonicum]|uniref:hypothetical protein n=1 Tax=Clostridium saccharoperbutylacetonicum TaxID=36745 RepID=UPI0039EB71F6